MLDKNDFQALREMFRENNIVLREEMRDEMQEMIVASQESIVRQIRDEVSSLICASEHRVISQVTNFIGLSIVPQFDDHETRLIRLEQKII